MKTSEQCGGKKKGEERRNDENKFHARGKGKERKGKEEAGMGILSVAISRNESRRGLFFHEKYKTEERLCS